MDYKSPISDDLLTIVPVLTQTVKMATQAVNQSTAPLQLLISKGLLTKAEFDEEVGKRRALTDMVLEALDQLGGTSNAKVN